MIMMTHLKKIMGNAEDGSSVEELEFDLNLFRETRPNLDADGTVDLDRDMATNKSWSLSVDETVKEYLPQLAKNVEKINSNKNKVSNEPILPPSRNEVEKTMQILSR